MNGTKWTTRRIDKAARLWAENKTGGEIAKAMKATRSSVLGMMFRNRPMFPMKTATDGNAAFGRGQATGEITKQPCPAASKPKPQPKERKMVEPVRVVVPPLPVQKTPKSDAFAPLPGVRPVLFHEASGCRWPVTLTGNVMEASTHCCGARRLAGSSYCPAHKALSVGPGTVSERDAVRQAKRAIDAGVRRLEVAA